MQRNRHCLCTLRTLPHYDRTWSAGTDAAHLIVMLIIILAVIGATPPPVRGCSDVHNRCRSLDSTPDGQQC